LDVLLGKKVGAHIRKLITSYHQFHLSQWVRHTDLHPWNIMIIPSKKWWLPDLGVIDFGRVHIDNRKEILKRYGIE
jgi:Ser/Thr protein kinase RdoA (MazF antagonist)